MSQIPSKVNPELARIQFREDYDLIMKNDLPDMYSWVLTPDFDNLILYVDLWATDENSSKIDDYHLKFDMSYYRTSPPSVEYINPKTKNFDPVKDLQWLPTKTNNPVGNDTAYIASHSFPNGWKRQMVCNSMILEYYYSGHNPTQDQKWDASKHTFAATLLSLQAMLRKPYYGGRTASP